MKPSKNNLLRSHDHHAHANRRLLHCSPSRKNSVINNENGRYGTKLKANPLKIALIVMPKRY